MRYRVTPQTIKLGTTATDTADTVQATVEIYVPTSPEGETIKARVRQPRQLRPPVGYKLDFLEHYHPNHTAYLPLDADKAHFVTLVLTEFKALHAGNAVRFGIGPLKLAAWWERHGHHT